MNVSMILIGLAIILGVYFFFAVVPAVMDQELEKKAPEIIYTGVIEDVMLYPVAAGYTAQLYQCYVKITKDDGNPKTLECTGEAGKILSEHKKERYEFVTKKNRIKSYKKL